MNTYSTPVWHRCGAAIAFTALAACLLWAWSTWGMVPGTTGQSHYHKLSPPHEQHSSGPPHQRELRSHNATSWLKQHDMSQYTFRIEDSTFVPKQNLLPHTQRTQDWFRQRYPGLRAFYESGQHVDPSALAEAEATDDEAWQWVVVDDFYHIAHSVAVLRRYYDATVTGNHECIGDLDQFHIHHSLETLEAFVFSNTKPMTNRSVRVTSHTKVCY